MAENEIQEILQLDFGNAVHLKELCWASRFSDVTRQVEHYQQDRVLLAGDAAHVHLPLGGQGLNLGLQDAFNLGWKLAAQVHGWGSEAVLASYERERHPVGARVLQNTRAQALLMDHDNHDVLAFLGIFLELMKLPDTNHYLAGLMSGLDVRYDIAGSAEGALIGTRIPDLLVERAGQPIRISDFLSTGHWLLLGGVNSPELETLVSTWSSHLLYVLAHIPQEAGWQAVLVRPDGYVCWVNEDSTVSATTLSRLQEQLYYWFSADFAKAA